MNVLAIGTATSELYVAAEGSIGSFLVAASGRQEQAAALLPFMEEAAERAGFALKQTELVTAAEGPGAFTGLRLGYAAAKAIELSAGCPFIPVPTFESWGASLAGAAGLLLCVMDAKKKRFYAQFFLQGKPLTSSMDITAEEAAQKALILLKKIKDEGGINVNPPMLSLAGPHAGVLASNEGFAAAIGGQTLLEGAPVLQLLPVPSCGIFFMMALAKEKLKLYNRAHADVSIGPVYIRKSDAEVSQ